MPQIYGLPKIHEEGVPLRPIVCTIGSPNYVYAKELARILSSLTGGTSSFVKNSTNFVEKISTQVPVEDVFVIIKVRLKCYETLCEETVMTQNKCAP